MEVYNLHWQVIHTEDRLVTIKATSVRNATRALKPTVLVRAVMDPLNLENNMDIVRGNDCVVDIIDNPRTQYLINGACILVEREPNTAVMTNSISDREGGTIPLVSGSTMGTKGGLTVYNQSEGGGGATDTYTPSLTL